MSFDLVVNIELMLLNFVLILTSSEPLCAIYECIVCVCVCYLIRVCGHDSVYVREPKGLLEVIILIIIQAVCFCL